jgi:hypothetical protein
VIVLIECPSSDRSDSTFGNKLADENHASLRISPNIEANIDLFKALMKRYRNTSQAGAVKLETDQA